MAKTEKRILIINADDLGYTRGVNLAIGECAAKGMVRSASLMANGYAFDHAVEILRKHSSLDVGVHLVLTELPPASSPAKIGGLTDYRGLLPATPRELMTHLAGGRISKDSIRQELSTQIGKLVDHGLRPTHLDSHKHVHALPQVLETVIELAHKFSVPWIRAPFDGAGLFRLGHFLDRKGKTSLCTQVLKAKLIGSLRTGFYKRMRDSGLRTPDHFFGISCTGIWNAALMIHLFEDLQPGVTEWMVHPGNYDGDLERMSTRLLDQREKERDLLQNTDLHRYLVGQGIILSSFHREAQ
jgi:predicted glycoside hydrolase/deacetylase ChbG (UPF0249 family)